MNPVNINFERPQFSKEDSARNMEVVNRWISDSAEKLNMLVSILQNEETHVDATGDSIGEATMNFTSSDVADGSAAEWTSVPALASGEKHNAILGKVSQMFKNVRYLFKILGTTDISGIGDGTATGAISSLSADLAKLYPVGSIYISANSTSPAELFGGTWEQIKDQFLLAAGDTYAAGDSGGSASHSHTLSANGAACIGNYADVTAFYTGYKYFWKDYSTGTNMWAWTHNGDGQLTSSMTHYNDGSFVGLTGSTDSDNSMPPYLVLYMWQRVA